MTLSFVTAYVWVREAKRVTRPLPHPPFRVTKLTHLRPIAFHVVRNRMSRREWLSLQPPLPVAKVARVILPLKSP